MKNEKNFEEITVEKRKIEKMLKSLEELDGSAQIKLSYILIALFPTVWNNIQSALKDSYTKGYLQGYLQGKQES